MVENVDYEEESEYSNGDGHEFFAEVDEEYIRDNFNLYGLRSRVGRFQEALEMILSPDAPDEEDLQDDTFLEIYQEATDLYGLIHSRFIISQRGLQIMREKYLSGRFGNCPRVMCERQNVLPIGMSEELRTSRVKVFCPKCEEVYIPKQRHADVDGAYFGLSFPNILLMSYTDLTPQQAISKYIPRVYGFKIYGKRGSKYYQEIQQEVESIPVEQSKQDQSLDKLKLI